MNYGCGGGGGGGGTAAGSGLNAGTDDEASFGYVDPVAKRPMPKDAIFALASRSARR